MRWEGTNWLVECIISLYCTQHVRVVYAVSGFSPPAILFFLHFKTHIWAAISLSAKRKYARVLLLHNENDSNYKSYKNKPSNGSKKSIACNLIVCLLTQKPGKHSVQEKHKQQQTSTISATNWLTNSIFLLSWIIHVWYVVGHIFVCFVLLLPTHTHKHTIFHILKYDLYINIQMNHTAFDIFDTDIFSEHEPQRNEKKDIYIIYKSYNAADRTNTYTHTHTHAEHITRNWN